MRLSSMDHEVFVVMKMPSLVSAMISAKVPSRGSMEMLVIRIKNGRLTDLYRNPNYTGITPEFWGSCDAVAGLQDWVVWGTPNCGKGQPGQVGRVGHGAVPARFRNVQVGVR